MKSQCTSWSFHTLWEQGSIRLGCSVVFFDHLISSARSEVQTLTQGVFIVIIYKYIQLSHLSPATLI